MLPEFSSSDFLQSGSGVSYTAFSLGRLNCVLKHYDPAPTKFSKDRSPEDMLELRSGSIYENKSLYPVDMLQKVGKGSRKSVLEATVKVAVFFDKSHTTTSKLRQFTVRPTAGASGMGRLPSILSWWPAEAAIRQVTHCRY